jgi:hypothetical protein
MSTIGETFYPVHTGRTHPRGQDLTPYSAVRPPRAQEPHVLQMQHSHIKRFLTYIIPQVSSFNLPVQYDSSLITPVSLTRSPSITTTALITRKDMEVKLSPSEISPSYTHFLEGEEEYTHSTYNPPMKHKNPSGTLHISAADNSFPASPLVCYSPYFGSFGVSATPVSASESAASMNTSSNMNSAGGSGSAGRRSRHNTPPRSNPHFRGHAQAPVLLSAPNPLDLRPATKQESASYHHSSMHTISPSSAATSRGIFCETLGPLPPRGRKRKSMSHDGEIILQGEMNFEEQVLMQLTEKENLQWKEVAKRFQEQTGKAMKVPALQMRKKRLIERLRVWTPSEVM